MEALGMTKACTSVVVANSNRTMVTVHSAMKPRCTSCVSSEKLPHRRRHRFCFSVSTAVIVTNGYNSGLTPPIAFLFPGQGSQFAGMGKALAGAYPVARRIFEEADDALGFSISRLSFEGPEDRLKLTENTQPALLTVSIAAFEVLKERDLAPDYVAGHSLGEYSALVAAGSLRFADAVRLVRKRGRYMQEAVPPGVGAMAALLKLPEGKLDGVLEQAAQGQVVSAANLHSADQVVIAGDAAAVARAMQRPRAAGARRAVLFPVSARFRCPLMSPARERLRADLDSTDF